jgi:Flp pilus assembly protein TadG
MALVRPRARERDEAQSLVEFALIVPMLLILIFGIIDFGMGLRAYISVAAATREGARYGSVGNPPGTFTLPGGCDGTTTNTAVGRVCATISGLNLANVQKVKVESCTASPPLCSPATTSNMLPGRSVRVTADYKYYYFTPVKALVNLVSAGTLSDYLTISSTTDMRIE